MPVSFPGIIIYLHFSITASQMPGPDSGVARTAGGREGGRGEGGAEGGGGTLANRTRPWRGGAVFFLVNKSGGETGEELRLGETSRTCDQQALLVSSFLSTLLPSLLQLLLLPLLLPLSVCSPLHPLPLYLLLPPPTSPSSSFPPLAISPPSSSRASLMATVLIGLCASVT